LFLASSKEVGFALSDYQYDAEGTCFDLFTTDNSSRTGFMRKTAWWLRSAYSNTNNYFHFVNASGYCDGNLSYGTYTVVPAFVIG
jgi:hypothetical protein